MIRSPTRSGDDLPILPRALRRDVIFILTIKAAALFLIAQVFFQGSNSHPALEPNAVAQHLLNANSPSGEMNGPR